MSIHPCRECGKTVSSEAPSCPHCGVPSAVSACRECAGPTDAAAARCPHCGAPGPVVAQAAARAPQDAAPESAEVEASTGLLYIGTNGYVLAIHPEDGQEIWRAKLGGTFTGPQLTDVCIIEHYGRVFAGSHGHLLCLNAYTGEPLWRNELKGLGHNDVTLAIGGQSVQFVAAQERAPAA